MHAGGTISGYYKIFRCNYYGLIFFFCLSKLWLYANEAGQTTQTDGDFPLSLLSLAFIFNKNKSWLLL